MQRDYAKPQPAAGHRFQFNVPIECRWLLVGVLIGLFISFLIYIKLSPINNTTKVAVKTTPTINQKPQLFAKAPKQNAEKKPQKPTFEFYSMLPNIDDEAELLINDKPRNNQQKMTQKTSQSKTGDTYLLQLAAFKQFKSADQLKAKLALNGIKVSIDKVTLPNGQTWHRVQQGPYPSAQAAKMAKSTLLAKQINTKLVKVSVG